MCRLQNTGSQCMAGLEYIHDIIHWTKQGKSEGFDSCNQPSILTLDSSHWFSCLKISWITWKKTLNSGQNWQSSCPMWPWNIMDCHEKQQGTSSMLHQALCIFSKPSVDSNWSYNPVILKFSKPSVDSNWSYNPVILKFDRWPSKTIGHLSQATSSFVHHFVSICELDLSRNC